MEASLSPNKPESFVREFLLAGKDSLVNGGGTQRVVELMDMNLNKVLCVLKVHNWQHIWYCELIRDMSTQFLIQQRTSTILV